MSDRKEKATADRRSFLKLAGVGALTGGAAMALGKAPVEASEIAPDGKSYRETEHVKAFYASARF
jgi:hypothetical protein